MGCLVTPETYTPSGVLSRLMVRHRRPLRARSRTLAILVVGLTLVLTFQSTQDSAGLKGRPASVVFSDDASPQILPGDFVTFSCVGENITLNGASVCDNQSAQVVNLGGGPQDFHYQFQATPGVGSSGWASTGDACLGGTIGGPQCPQWSGLNPVTLWGYCAPDERCGGTVKVPTTSPPNCDNYTILVFNGLGKVNIGGSFYSDGQTYSTSCEAPPVEIQPSSIAGGFEFDQWIVTGGSIRYESYAYFLWPSITSTSGYIVMSLQDDVGYNWAGYVASAAPGSRITSVAGTFNIPRIAFDSSRDGRYGSGEEVAFWVGLGGWQGNESFWQAGISETTYNATPAYDTIAAWYESIGPGCYPQKSGFPPNTCPPVNITGAFAAGLAFGQEISVNLSVASGNSFFSFVDDTNGLKYSGSIEDFTPSGTPADWIGEPNASFMPIFWPVTFAQPSYQQANWGSSVQSYLAPILNVTWGGNGGFCTPYASPVCITASPISENDSSFSLNDTSYPPEG